MTAVPISGSECEARSVRATASVDTIRALCHDLRQPLTAIMLLAATEGGDAKRRLETILDQARWLANLVDDVLVDAAADRLTDVNVTTLVWNCVLRARPTARCTVDFVGQEGLVARAQPVALGRAVSCILDNAVRAASDGGHVRVSTTADKDHVLVVVEDDGPGIGHVESHNSLGLPITRALVAACDGSFRLTARQAGGAVATIRLVPVAGGAKAS